jgi:hypothetical protein
VRTCSPEQVTVLLCWGFEDSQCVLPRCTPLNLFLRLREMKRNTRLLIAAVAPWILSLRAQSSGRHQMAEGFLNDKYQDSALMKAK